MVKNEKRFVSRANIAHLGGCMALWEEADGSKYIALDNHEDTRFYGPLTVEQLAAYELLMVVEQEPDDWVAPEPLLDVSTLPKKVRTAKRLEVMIMTQLKRTTLPKGSEVIIYDYKVPTRRKEPHMVSFKLIDVEGSVNSCATVEAFNLKTLTDIVDTTSGTQSAPAKLANPKG